jgi:putative endonuclease
MPYYVYIMASVSGTLYTGVTNNLERRVQEHKSGRGSQFTAKYRIIKLVHYETLGDIRQAIEREKQIKKWRREKKVRLIEEENPGWRDLAIDWLAPRWLSYLTCVTNDRVGESKGDHAFDVAHCVGPDS